MRDACCSTGLPTGSLEVDDPQVIEILDQYLARLQAGEPPNSEELIARCPELADELRAYFDSIDFLRQAAVDTDASLLEDWSGRTLGDYKILREIGRGGMGIVYEAKQTSLDRRVALKVLPFSAVLDGRQITRFTIEAQAAAQLHHPHIVPIYGVGSERGIHFYSMQFIDGRSLDVVIDELRAFPGRTASGDRSDVSQAAFETARGFSTDRSTQSTGYVRSVARLGIEAAEALQHAHDCGVVHRDVKPSNLLLDREGKLWVADFGLARFSTDASVTLAGAVLGTVRYMSPEQAAGDTVLVDHRSDIYSLGVTLYELLTLRGVFDAENREQYMRQIEFTEPQSPRRINSAVPVDLETIILKAMSKRRSQRYATAAAMADDLHRFLTGSPIAARRPSLLDRAAKFAARHKAVVRASLALLLLMFVGAWVAVLLIAREQRQTSAALVQAQENFRQARDVLGDFGVLMADRLAELPGAEPLREQVLDRTLAYYDRLIEQASNDPSLQADLAVTCFKAAELRERMGQARAAFQSYARAARLFEQLQASQPASTKLRHDLAACYNNIALLQASLGESAAARSAYEDAIRLQRQLAETSTDPDDRLSLASMLHNLGALLQQTGKADQAQALHREAIAIQQGLSEQFPEDLRVRRELAMSYNNLSFLQRDADLTQAIRHNEQALAILRESAASPDADAMLQADLAVSLNNRGALQSRRGDLETARAAYEEAVAIYARLAKRAPAVVHHRRDLAVSLNNLGRVVGELHETTAAEVAFASARDTLAALVDDAPNELSYRSSLGGVLNNLALLCERSDRVDEAIAAYEQAIEHQRFCLEQAPTVEPFHAFLARACENYARLLRATGKTQRADEVEQAKRIWLASAEAAQDGK